MAVCFHSNGTAALTVCGSFLGYTSSDGVTIDITEFFQDIYTDLLGPSVPNTVLRNGSTATISFDLVDYDAVVLNTYMANREGGVLGQEGIIGEPMYGGCNGTNRTCALSIASPNDGVVYNFPVTWINDDASVVLSTQLKIWTLVIRAVPNPANFVLYTLTSS